MDQNSNLFPATYQAPLRHRVVPVLIFAPLFPLAMFGRVHLNANSSIGLWIFAIVAFVFLVTSLLNTTSCKLILYNDRIEKRTWFGKKTMKRNDIGKFRKHNWQTIMIVYKNNSGDGMVIPKGIGGDATWNAWMADIPGNEVFKRTPYDV